MLEIDKRSSLLPQRFGYTVKNFTRLIACFQSKNNEP